MLKWIAQRFRAGTGTDTAALLAQAQALRADDQLDAARELAQEILRDDPEHAGAMALLAALAADRGQAEAGLQWARRALAADPACVPAHFAMGRLHEGQERLADAEACYRQVVRLDPAHAKGHTNLGCMLHLQSRIPEAVECYRRALRIEPGQPEALRNYALVAGGAEQLREATEGFERHVARHPQDAQAHYQLAHLHLHVGRHEDALAGYERAIALAPGTAEFHFARGQQLLLLGRYEEGWREYEWRWQMELLNQTLRRFREPRWEGQPLDGTLLVHSDNGFGDVFQLARYLPLLARRCRRVVVECHPALRELIAGVEGVADTAPEGGQFPPFDAHIPPVALPYVFGTTLETIPWSGPYLRADAQRLQDWAQRVAATQPVGRKVGLVWAGNPGHLANRERSLAFDRLAGLADVPGVTFFSLQKGAGVVGPADIPPGMRFVDLTEGLRNFSDTAALVAQLDLVIAVDTAVAHLAGAVGCPTWVLLPFSPDWRWLLGRDDSPWYPGMRLFRQEKEAEWSVPIARLTKALREWAAA